jgi:hypothetical protein
LVLELGVKTGVKLIWTERESVAVLYDGKIISGIGERM